MALLGALSNAMQTNLGRQGNTHDPVVQLMQQATLPGIPEDVRQSSFRYDKQLAEEHSKNW